MVQQETGKLNELMHGAALAFLRQSRLVPMCICFGILFTIGQMSNACKSSGIAGR